MPNKQDSQLASEHLSQLLVDKIFNEQDTDFAEFTIASIVENLENNLPLKPHEKLYLIRSFNNWIANPEEAKAAFGIKRKDKKGNFKLGDFKKRCRDHLIVLYELKLRDQGLKGDNLLEALQNQLGQMFSIDARKVQRAKTALKDEYSSKVITQEIIDRRIAEIHQMLG